MSWRLDGPPPAEASTLRRRAVLRTLASPRGDGYETAAAAAAAALERALLPEAEGPSPWPLFRGTPTRAGAFAVGQVPGADAKGVPAPSGRPGLRLAVASWARSWPRPS